MYNNEFYQNLKKPYLSPPSNAFKIVWPILYALMLISLFLIINGEGNLKFWAITIFTFQLILNILWSPIFFILQKPKIALLISIFLTISVFLMILIFFKISVLSAFLQIPYLIWLCFATYLNIGIIKLNPNLEE